MTISVALCTYNGEKFLAEQLDSILNQSIAVTEIVVCDDGSTDTTKSILLEYQRKFPAVFLLFFNDNNLGYVKNFEKAISLCNGDLIFFCDQDDIWLKHKVETILSTTKQNPNKNIFAHRIDILEKNNEISTTSFWDINGFDKNFSNKELLKYLLFQRNVFPGMSLTITKEAKEKYLPLKTPHQQIIHDYELILKGCNDNAFLLIDEVLTLYRMHENQNIGFDTNINNYPMESVQTIYSKIKRFELVKNGVIALKLDSKLVDLYKEKCREDYRKFILNSPIPKRWITHLKMKYYYKILDEIS